MKRNLSLQSAPPPSASDLRKILDGLRAGLERGAQPLDGRAGATSPNASRLAEGLLLVSNEYRKRMQCGAPGFASSSATVSAHDAHKLLSLLNELSELRRVRVAMAIGPRHLPTLRQALAADALDLLGIFRKEEDENAHSDVIRWLLDPQEAPNLAPRMLLSLSLRFSDRTEWRQCMEHALRAGGISVRRELVVGQRDGDQTNLDRIDLVISGKGFVIGIENKVNAAEHEGQTRGYAKWLNSINGQLKGGLFLSPSGVPAMSADFVPISYLDLTKHLLEAATNAALTSTETQVLRAYLRTLSSRILRSEFNAVAEM